LRMLLVQLRIAPQNPKTPDFNLSNKIWLKSHLKE